MLRVRNDYIQSIKQHINYTPNHTSNIKPNSGNVLLEHSTYLQRKVMSARKYCDPLCGVIFTAFTDDICHFSIHDLQCHFFANDQGKNETCVAEGWRAFDAQTHTGIKIPAPSDPFGKIYKNIERKK